ncbi:MAG TPA: hypothetical protein VF290_20195 [Pyrinomonadaceae bacterium]
MHFAIQRLPGKQTNDRFKVLAIYEDCYCRQIQDAKLFASFPIFLIVSVDRSDENVIFVSITDFAEHLIHSYVMRIPASVKMEDGDTVASDDCAKFIGQDFGCG